MAMQFMIISLGILAIQSVCNTFGPETIAGFVSATRIEQLALQPMISFGIAMAVYSAQNYGAQKYDRIRKGVRQCSLVSLGFCLFAIGAMLFYGQELISVFTAEHDDLLLQQAMLYLHTSVPFYIFSGNFFCLPQRLAGHGDFQRAAHQQHHRAGVPRLVGFCLGRHVGFFRHLLRQPDLLGRGLPVYGGRAHFYVQHTMRKLQKVVVQLFGEEE